MATSEPVVVLYKSNMCRHCTSLTNIWGFNDIKDNDDTVTAHLRKVHPKIRTHVVTANNNSGKFDENIAPKDLKRYGKWFPMILLVPGKLWDSAMSKLGPKNDVQLIDGVQIMNGILVNDSPDYVQKYDIRKPAEFARWLRDSMDNPDFKRIQYGLDTNSIVPTIQSQSTKSIPPLLTSIIKPINTSSSYAMTGESHIATDANNKTALHNNFGISGDICSMRIISRPH